MAQKITLDLIKKVRNDTGAGMMDVKKALTEAEGDPERDGGRDAEVHIGRPENGHAGTAGKGRIIQRTPVRLSSEFF